MSDLGEEKQVGKSSLQTRSLDYLRSRLHQMGALPVINLNAEDYLKRLERHLPKVLTGDQLAVVCVAALLEASDLHCLRHRSDSPGRAMYLLRHTLTGLIIDSDELRKGAEALETLLAMSQGLTSTLAHMKGDVRAWTRFE